VLVWLGILAAGGAIALGLPAPRHAALTRSGGSSSLPQAALAPASGALGRDDPAYAAAIAPGTSTPVLHNPAQRLSARFSPEGVRVGAGPLSLVLSLRGYGYGDAMTPVGSARPTAHANRVLYRRSGLQEWYSNGPYGLEQGFTLSASPRVARTGPLTIALGIRAGSGGISVSAAGRALTISRAGRSLSYRDLIVTDARFNRLPAWMSLARGRLLLHVDDAGARYPLVVDPVLQTANLTASDGQAHDAFGHSVAVTGDTAVVGAPAATIGSHLFQGAVYVFVRSHGVWSQEAKLTPAAGASGEDFGWSVAISENETVVVGAPGLDQGAHGSQGAAYVFRREFVSSGSFGAIVWSELAKLEASSPIAGSALGFSVGTSGGTVVAGAPLGVNAGGMFDQGAAYVFSEPSGGWHSETQQAILTASDGAEEDQLGHGVGVSGSTVMAGAPQAKIGAALHQGAVYAFKEPSGGWANETQQAKLTSSSGLGTRDLGEALAMSGSTVVAGAPSTQVGTSNFQGAAYVFTEPSGGWVSGTQQAVLTASDGADGDLLGSSVAISGNSVLAGAPEAKEGANFQQGAAYLFIEPAGGWHSETAKAKLEDSTGVEDEEFGYAVGVSGETYVVGARAAPVGSNERQGEAEVFEYLPDITICVPCTGVPHRVTLEEQHVRFLTSQVGGSLPYVITATDPENAVTSLSCMPGLEGVLGIGTTTIECSAGDLQGHTSRGAIAVTLVDDTAPALHVPSNIAVPAESPGGAKVTYTVTATDPDNSAPELKLSCSPESGSTFPVGETTVECTASDPPGNASRASFKVTVFIPLNPGLTECNGYYGGSGQEVVVPVGATCVLPPGTKVATNMHVMTGGTLIDQGATIGGDLNANNPKAVTVAGGNVQGDVQLQGVAGSPAGDKDNYVCDTSIGHDLSVQNSAATAGTIVIGGPPDCSVGDKIGHDLSVQNNATAVTVSDNTVTHNLSIQNNTGGVTVETNKAGEDLEVQNNSGGVTVTNNHAGHNAQCRNNKPTTGGSGNTAGSQNKGCP
jgi:hypothetical protein